jgi:hypothetical protein
MPGRPSTASVLGSSGLTSTNRLSRRSTDSASSVQPAGRVESANVIVTVATPFEVSMLNVGVPRVAVRAKAQLPGRKVAVTVPEVPEKLPSSQ